MPVSCKILHMPSDKKTLTFSLLVAALVMFALFACACVSAPAPTIVPQPVSPPVTPNVTPDAGNTGTLPLLTPPARICNCPMEPVGAPTATLTATPDDGLCHCP